MEEDTEAEIQEIADREEKPWSAIAYNLIKSALRERKRLAEKNAKRKNGKEVSS
jgi:hypothetical protein